MAEEQCYALCVEAEEGTTEVVYFELDEGAMGALGMSVYTAPDGELQRRHLEDVDDVDIVIAPKSHEELLDAMHTGVPGSVYVDGEDIRLRVQGQTKGRARHPGPPTQGCTTPPRSGVSSHNSGAGCGSWRGRPACNELDGA
jgi:hypothetical protein